MVDLANELYQQTMLNANNIHELEKNQSQGKQHSEFEIVNNKERYDEEDLYYFAIASLAAFVLVVFLSAII